MILVMIHTDEYWRKGYAHSLDHPDYRWTLETMDVFVSRDTYCDVCGKEIGDGERYWCSDDGELVHRDHVDEVIANTTETT